jgi:hypothetical protein
VEKSSRKNIIIIVLQFRVRLQLEAGESLDSESEWVNSDSGRKENTIGGREPAPREFILLQKLSKILIFSSD